MLFDGSDKPTQLMAISQQEMEKTEDAVCHWTIYYAYMYAPQFSVAAVVAYNSAPRIGSAINCIRYSNWAVSVDKDRCYEGDQNLDCCFIIVFW